MTEKEQFEACMKIVEAADKRRRDREDFEWKLSIAFWTMILLATQFLAANPSSFDGLVPRGVAAVVAFLIYFLFALGLAGAHRFDGDSSKHYRKQGTLILSAPAGQVHQIVAFDDSRRTGVLWSSWGPQFQLLTTAFLLLAFVFLRTVPSPLNWGI